MSRYYYFTDHDADENGAPQESDPADVAAGTDKPLAEKENDDQIDAK